MAELTWSKTEKKIARAAFDKAYLAECRAILEAVRAQADGMDDPRDVWKIEGYLERKDKDIRPKFDYRYSVLPMVFAWMIDDNLISLDDLDGLREDKIGLIERLLELRRSP